MDFLKLLVVSICLANFSLAQDWDPLGEIADYTSVNDGQRTSSFISSGHIHTEVEDERLDEEDYLIKLQFSLNTWFSTEVGTVKLGLPWDYYEEGFLDELAQSSEPYKTSEFSMKYIGRKDVKLVDGRKFAGTYLLKFYDIKKKVTFERNGVSSEVELEGAEITVAVVVGMPVIGAVQIDIKGVYWGYDIVMGADLNAE